MPNAIYGDMLSAFGELSQLFLYFDQDANFSDGYIDDLAVATLSGIFQTRGGSRVTRNDNLVRENHLVLWCPTELTTGFFVQFNSVTNNTYRIVGDKNWESTGGFFRYELERVVGTTGQANIEPTFNLGEGEFV